MKSSSDPVLAQPEFLNRLSKANPSDLLLTTTCTVINPAWNSLGQNPCGQHHIGGFDAWQATFTVT